MSELGSSAAAVGIESVEWLDAGSGQLTVRVSGRWRRRRGWIESRGPTVLVVEAEGRRHRFPATPEPPSLAGVAPGTWRLSFTVPADLAPDLGGHVWLALGTVTVALPAPASALAESTAPPSEPAPAREPLEPAREPLESAREPLERAVPDDPREPEQPLTPAPEAGPGAPIASETAEDLAAAEPLEIERAWRRAEDAQRAASELGDRVSELERALRRERAARESAARASVDPESAPLPLTPPPDAVGALPGAPSSERDRLRAEAALRDRHRADDLRVPAEPTPRPALATAVPPAIPAAPPAIPEAATAGAVPIVPVVPAPTAFRATATAASVATTTPALDESATLSALRRELTSRVVSEASLRARVVAAETRLATRVLLDQRTSTALAELRDELQILRVEIADERDRRERAEAETRRLRDVLDGQRERSHDAYAALGELRGTLDRLRPSDLTVGSGSPRPALASPPPAPVPVAPDSPAPAAAESSAAAAESSAPAAARSSGPAAPETAAVDRAGASPIQVTPEALSDALARLRRVTEPRDSEAPNPRPDDEPPAAPAPPPPAPRESEPAAAAPGAESPAVRVGRPTLERPFAILSRRDPDRAGRLLLGLLGAQGSAYPHPLSYDLSLGPGYGCVQVTVGPGGATEVQTAGAGRGRERVDLQIVGEPARLARLLRAGRLRRMLCLGLARVRGRRDGLAAIRALLTLPLDLTELPAGAVPEPEPLLALVAAMIDPGWTAGERFTVSHTDERGRTVHLHVRDGASPVVSLSAPEGRVSTALAGSAGELVRTLWGPLGEQHDGSVAGDRGPLELLRTWIDRAQAG